MGAIQGQILTGRHNKATITSMAKRPRSLQMTKTRTGWIYRESCTTQELHRLEKRDNTKTI